MCRKTLITDQNKTTTPIPAMIPPWVFSRRVRENTITFKAVSC